MIAAKNWLMDRHFKVIHECDDLIQCKRGGRNLRDFWFSDTRVRLDMRRIANGIEVEAKYDQFVLFDTGDLEKFLSDVLRAGGSACNT